MKPFKILLTTLLLTTSLHVLAQWQWTDADGHRVFSDRPPPSDIPEKSIIKRPSTKVGTSAPERAPSLASEGKKSAEGDAAASASPVAPVTDKDLEAKKKKKDEEEKAKLKAEQERIAKEKIENCARAKQAKATYDSGTRIARVNEKGEREIMDDTTRAAEASRAQEVINRDCR